MAVHVRTAWGCREHIFQPHQYIASLPWSASSFRIYLQATKPLRIHVESAGGRWWVNQGDRSNPDMPSEAKPRRVQTSPDCTVRCSFTPKETGYIRKEQLLAFLHATFGSKKQYGEQVSVVKLSNTSKSACTHAQQTMNERWSFYAPRRVTYVSLRLKLHVCCVRN